MTLVDIGTLVGIVTSYLLILGMSLKSNSDKKDVESKVKLNENEILYNKETLNSNKQDTLDSFKQIENSHRESHEALLTEIKESNKLLGKLNDNIIRFEERQETQWKTLERHAKEIDSIKSR